jgi:hypothetical protein
MNQVASTGCACSRYNLTISSTLSILNLLRHLCLKLQKRVQWLTSSCAQTGLFAVFGDATASPSMNPDSLSPRNRTDVIFGHDTASCAGSRRGLLSPYPPLALEDSTRSPLLSKPFDGRLQADAHTLHRIGQLPDLIPRVYFHGRVQITCADLVGHLDELPHRDGHAAGDPYS